MIDRLLSLASARSMGSIGALPMNPRPYVPIEYVPKTIRPHLFGPQLFLSFVELSPNINFHEFLEIMSMESYFLSPRGI